MIRTCSIHGEWLDWGDGYGCPKCAEERDGPPTEKWEPGPDKTTDQSGRKIEKADNDGD